MSSPTLGAGARPARDAFRDVPYMGVIWVVAEAMKLGFVNGHPDWCNLGQGQPEVGELPGAPPRFDALTMQPHDQAYGPVDGTPALREAVAAHYNRLYRQGKASQYGAENVSIAAGGRLVLSRVFAALRAGRVGHQVPDYTAYEDLFDAHAGRIEPVTLFAAEEDGFALPPEKLAAAVGEHELDAFLLSNPCNPTGRVIRGDVLDGYVRVGRESGCLMLLDEFYSHFVFEGERPADGPVSAAAHVDDVESDPVLIVDGLTKSFRYPGWRVGWAVGPKELVSTLGRAASAIDGGPGQPIQRAAVEVLQPERADGETDAVRAAFSRKRNLMCARLEEMGVRVAVPSESTFYVWGSIADLPAPLDDADAFFHRALARRVMTVPGRFFDVNPGKRRRGASPLARWMRFSFGPPEDNVALGLDRLAEMVAEARG